MRHVVRAVLVATILAQVANAQTDWRRASPATSPSARYGAAMAYDPVRERVLLIGGVTARSSVPDDAWEWDGANWLRVPSFGTPFGLDPLLAYDPVGGGILVLGNAIGQGTLRWDGTGWTRVASQALSPPHRTGAAIASTRDGVIVFGGGGLNAPPSNETWHWAGGQWTRRGSVTNPPERSYCQMAYDSVQQRVLMSGGFGGNNRYRDTWEWVDGWWNVLFVGPAPYAAGMVFDTQRGRAVKVGSDNPVFTFGTYELPQTAQSTSPWQQRVPVNLSLPHSSGFAMAFDHARGETVVFGGRRGVATSETWLYAPVNAASYTTFGTGCPGSHGVPMIAAEARPGNLPWIGERFNVVASGLGPAIGFMLLGFSDTTVGGLPLPLDLTRVGLPGCTLYMDARIAAAVGSHWSIEIPFEPNLVGLAFFQQAVSIRAPSLIGGFSNAGRGVIGAK